MELTIISFNVHNPRSHYITRIAQFLAQKSADFIGLQEISKKAAGQIAKRLGMQWHWKGCTWLGNALLTRFPVAKGGFQSLEIRVNTQSETRSAVLCQVTTDQGDLTVVTTHLDHICENVRLQQWQRLSEWFSYQPDIVMGDLNALYLNDYSTDALKTIILTRLIDKWEKPRQELMLTIQSDGWHISPFRGGTSRFDTRIDYILTSKGIRLIDSRVLSSGKLSDHKAISSTLSVKF